MAAKSGENCTFSLLHRILMYYPTCQKFAQNRSTSHGFRDIYIFLFSAKIHNGRQKCQKMKFFLFVQDIIVLLLYCVLILSAISPYTTGLIALFNQSNFHRYNPNSQVTDISLTGR